DAPPTLVGRRKDRELLEDVVQERHAVEVIAQKDALVVAVTAGRVRDVHRDHLIAVGRNSALAKKDRGGVAAEGRDRAERHSRKVRLGHALEQLGEGRRIGARPARFALDRGQHRRAQQARLLDDRREIRRRTWGAGAAGGTAGVGAPWLSRSSGPSASASNSASP